MPLFLDSHDVAGATPEAMAAAHMKDLAVQGRYGVRYIKYWMNEARGRAFCLHPCSSRAKECSAKWFVAA